jgi:hypothetical protein
VTGGAHHYSAAEQLLGQARALPPEARAEREALITEATVHVGLAQTAATMYGQLRAQRSAEDAWQEALSDKQQRVVQGQAEDEAEPEAGG